MRGPVGPQRFDTYAAMISMHSVRPYIKDAELSLDDFAPPWVDTTPVTDDDD